MVTRGEFCAAAAAGERRAIKRAQLTEKQKLWADVMDWQLAPCSALTDDCSSRQAT
jgi:hypothetical protein